MKKIIWLIKVVWLIVWDLRSVLRIFSNMLSNILFVMNCLYYEN